VLAACGGGGGGGPPASPNPLFGSLSFTTKENIALPAKLTATDPAGLAVSFAQGSNPASGTVSGFSSAGAFVYTPQQGFSGSDSFQVKVTDSAGNSTSGTVSITVSLNHPPVANSDIVRADGPALASINVLAKAQDPDGDVLTVTIDEAPLVGTAAVNSDGTVAISDLPSSFKGMTRFKYRVTDPSGASAAAAAVVFVGSDPYRAVFAGDASANGDYEVYLTDFAADPRQMTQATSGNVRLRGFAVADNGSTIAYRTQDTTAAAVNAVSFVRTATPSQQVAVALPAGVVPVQDADGNDQVRVSPDGNWIALVAGQSGSNALYVINVAAPATVTKVIPPGALYATRPQFTPDSKNLFFLATGIASGANKSLYLVSLASPGATALISAQSAPGGSDDVTAYSVSQDQSRILILANRGGAVGLYYINPTHLQTEVLVNQPLGPGESLLSSTISAPPGSGGGADGSRVAYTVQSLLTLSTYIAEVSATPNPRLVANTGALAVGLRPDAKALLFTQGGQMYEEVIDATSPTQLVGGGGNGWYDSTGNIVLLEQFLPTGGTPPSYPALAATVRGSFGTTQAVGSAVMAAQYINVTGFDRAVALIGEGPTLGPTPAAVQLALVNALAPTKLFNLAAFKSPLQLTSSVAQVVGGGP